MRGSGGIAVLLPLDAPERDPEALARLDALARPQPADDHGDRVRWFEDR
ncbi:hypothetical protein ACFVXG_14135 [Kitasatospora sp. NPDC058162]